MATRLSARLPGWWVLSGSLGSLGNEVTRDRHRYLNERPDVGRKPNPMVSVLPSVGGHCVFECSHFEGFIIVTAPLVGMTPQRGTGRFLVAPLAWDMIGPHVARGVGSMSAE